MDEVHLLRQMTGFAAAVLRPTNLLAHLYRTYIYICMYIYIYRSASIWVV